MSSLIMLIVSLLPFCLIAYYIKVVRSNRSVVWEIREGARCYNCKEEVVDFDWRLAFDKENKENFILCTCCSRSGSLDEVLGDVKTSRLLRLKKLLLSRRFQKFQWIGFASVSLLPIIGLVIKHYFLYDPHFTMISAVSNFIIWTLMIYQYKSSSVPKLK